jgi:hypothetical protein
MNRPMPLRLDGMRLVCRSAVDSAYVEKYSTPASLKWAHGLASAKRRDTTTELMPP